MTELKPSARAPRMPVADAIVAKVHAVLRETGRQPPHVLLSESHWEELERELEDWFAYFGEKRPGGHISLYCAMGEVRVEKLEVPRG